MGTHNYCIMLERGYFEPLATRQPTARNERWRNAAAIRVGLAAIALQTSDARSSHVAVSATGLEPSEPVEFGRPMPLPDGEAEARFAVTNLSSVATGGIPMFVCQHLTPTVVWHPAYLDQPNTTRRSLAAIRPTLVRLSTPMWGFIPRYHGVRFGIRRTFTTRACLRSRKSPGHLWGTCPRVARQLTRFASACYQANGRKQVLN